MPRTRLAPLLCGAILVLNWGPVAAGGPDAVSDLQPETGAAPPVNLLFIHHSCGGQLLAEPGPRVGGEADSGGKCIYVSHPNGGGLRSALERAGFRVNDASYGSIVGENTDFCHWHAKFRDQMDRILRTRRQDELLPAGQTNAIVAFKSCFPNNQFVGRGDQGDPDACVVTLANAQAAYRALLPLFAAQPEVLFIALTPPAMAEPTPIGLRQKVQALLRGKPPWADLAREFNNWLGDAQHGWLAGYRNGNVVVFDYYDLLTGHGASNWSRYPTGGGMDSHPSREGNRQAAEAFVPFLQRAWQAFRRTGAS